MLPSLESSSARFVPVVVVTSLDFVAGSESFAVVVVQLATSEPAELHVGLAVDDSHEMVEE